MNRKMEYVVCVLLLLSYAFSGCGNSVTSSSLPMSSSEFESSISSNVDEIFLDMQQAKILDWTVVQPETEKQIIAEMAGGYTADTPLVIVDPYKIAPLTALLIFDEEKDCSVKITIPGKTEDTTFTHSFAEVQKHHEIPVYGLYAGQENAVKLGLTYSDGTTKTVTVPIATEPLPDNLPPYQVVVNEQGKVGGEGDDLLYMSMVSGGVYPIAIDKQGDIRWYSTSSDFSGGIFRRMQDGRFLAMSEVLYAPSLSRSGIVRVDRMGKIYTEYLSALSHHDAIEMPNGNLLIASMRPGTETLISGMFIGLDTLVEIDGKTGGLVNEWDLNLIFGYRDAAGKLLNGGDKPAMYAQYLHTNAVWYNEKDNSIMVSSPSKKMVVKFKADTKEIMWVIADPRNEYPEPLQSKILKPIGDGFEWNCVQHAPMVLPNGYIMMDDNGTSRLDEQGKPVPDADNYSRLVIYDVNEADMTIRQIYQYGKERGNELFATYLGDVDYLGENHYLLNAGGRVVDDAGVAQGPAYEGQMGIKCAEAKIVEVRDDKVVFEIYVGTQDKISFNNIYRVEWDSVYAADEKEYDLVNTKTQRLGKFIPSKTVDYTLPESYDKLVFKMVNPVDYGYQLNVPVVIDGMAAKDILYIELKSVDNTYYYLTAGAGGAQGIVRAERLPGGEYAIGFVLQKEDGNVQYAQIEQKWIIK